MTSKHRSSNPQAILPEAPHRRSVDYNDLLGKVVPRYAIRRNHSTPAVQSQPIPIDNNHPRPGGRVSMDNYDRARFFRPMLADTAPTPPRQSRHKKSSSSPSCLLSPTLTPASPSPSVVSMTLTDENDVEPLNLPPLEQPTRSSLRTHASVASTPAGTPPPSPALKGTATAASSSVPSPSTTPPSSPSLSFLSTWGGRSKALIPSPMTPFRVAKKVATSVTSVGTGLLPTKERLESIPVAGRILRHPVMDSTLTYIASKTTQRGVDSKLIQPEDVHYRKLNKKLVDQSMTLAALALDKEDQSKAMDDEAGDDAFELYLAAIATLMHALPIETCDPLRREAFESQLRGFLDETRIESDEEDASTKQLRRRRRRRHRHHHDQATSLIHHYSPSASSLPSERRSSAKETNSNSTAVPPPGRRRRGQRRGRRNPDGTFTTGSSLGDTIISTAVESAIRLKQSPIPDVVRSCFRVSRHILAKVDERYHLQEKAWQISKQSLEKAIELDEQYAIHEVVTDTFFATVTGLVKAGIAYKETPSYHEFNTAKALTNAPAQGALPAPAGMDRPHDPQVMMDGRKNNMGRRPSVIAEEEEYEDQEGRGGEDEGLFDSDASSSRVSSSSSCFSIEGEGGLGDEDEDEEGDEEEDGLAPLLSMARSDQVRQRIDLFMALKGAATMFLGR